WEEIGAEWSGWRARSLASRTTRPSGRGGQRRGRVDSSCR
ncbi:MAG: hypothetical protein AVDCRST_MAG70-1805, partial [uncultured Thermomicrobiales bacterium]